MFITKKFNYSNSLKGFRYFARASRPTLPTHYDNFINGRFVPPVDGHYFDNLSPIGNYNIL